MIFFSPPDKEGGCGKGDLTNVLSLDKLFSSFSRTTCIQNLQGLTYPRTVRHDFKFNNQNYLLNTLRSAIQWLAMTTND